MVRDPAGNKPGSNGIHMPVAFPALLMGIEPLRHDHVQMILCSGHCDVK
jgi:hypothetical protein